MKLALLILLLCSFGIERTSLLQNGTVAYFDCTKPHDKAYKDPFTGWLDTIKGDAYHANNAYFFDGNLDFISAPYHPRYDITNRFTFSAWCKPNSLVNANFRMVFGRQNTASNNSVWAMLFDLQADSYSFYVSGQSGSSPYAGSHMAITDTRWHMVTYTYNGSRIRGYMDGVLIRDNAYTFTLAASNKPVTFGVGDSGATASTTWHGSMGIGIMMNRPMTNEEVLRLYRDTKKYYNY